MTLLPLEEFLSIVRQKAAEALVKNPSNKAVPALVNALNDEDIYVRSYAAEALGIIGCDTATDELVKALKDEDNDVRLNASVALGKVASETTISKLIKCLENGKFVDFSNHIGCRENLSDVIFALKIIRQRFKYYQPRPKPTISNSTSHNNALLVTVKNKQWDFDVFLCHKNDDN